MDMQKNTVPAMQIIVAESVKHHRTRKAHKFLLGGFNLFEQILVNLDHFRKQG